jgi:hypothetical protein
MATSIAATQISRHLNGAQLKAIDKVGDCLIPGDADLPPFSSTHCVSQVDRILDFMPAQDLGDLKMLLGILSIFPKFVLGWIFALLEHAPAVPGPLGPVVRMIRMGMRGLIMSLYYGDPGVLRKLGYEVKVYTGDLGRSV